MAPANRPRLSLSGFLFEDDYATQSLPLDDFCRLARDCAYDGVELRATQIGPDATARERDRVRNLLETHGLQVTCLTMRDRTAEGPVRDAGLSRHLDLCADLGCPLLKVSGSAAWLRHAVERASAAGVRLATNNHIGNPTETAAGADALLREVTHDHFGLLFDPMHLCLAGEDPVAPIGRWAPRIFNVLFQCVRPARPGERAVIHHRGVGWVKCRPTDVGAPPWPAMAEALRACHYDGWITVIENAWPRDERMRIAAESADYLRALFSTGSPTAGGL